MAFKASFLLFLVATVCADGPDYGGQQQQQQQGNNYGDNGHKDDNGHNGGGGYNGGSNQINIQSSASNGGYNGIESAPRPGNGDYGSLIPIEIHVPAPAAQVGYGGQIPQIQISAPRPDQGGYGGGQIQLSALAPQQGGYGGQLPQVHIGQNGYGGNGGSPASQGYSIAMPSVGYTKGYSINAPSGYGGNGGYVDDQAEERDYKFSYAVKDDYTYNQQTREENKNGNTITGQYTVLEPTGDLRIVNYVADDYGFRADVQNQGGHGPVAPVVKHNNGNNNGYGGQQIDIRPTYGQQEQQHHQQQHHQQQHHHQQESSGPAYGQQQEQQSSGSSYGHQDQRQQQSDVSYGQQEQHQSSGQNYGQQEQPSHPILAPVVSNYGQAAPLLLIQAPSQSYGQGPSDVQDHHHSAHNVRPAYSPEAPALHKPVLAAPAYRPVAPERKQSVGPTYGRPSATPQKHSSSSASSLTYGRLSAVPKASSGYERQQASSNNY